MLPVEVLEEIFSQFRRQNDIKSLANCCLTSKQLSAICRPLVLVNPRFASTTHLQHALTHLTSSSLSQIRRLKFGRSCPIPLSCQFIRKCPNLRELELVWHVDEQDAPLLISAARQLPQLRKIRFWRSYFMCDPLNIICSFYQHCPLLESIDWQCSEVNFLYLTSGTELPTPEHTAHHSPLSELRLSETTSITDSFLMNACANRQMENLKTLDLRLCRSVTDWSLAHSLPHLPNLTRIDLCGVQVTDIGIKALAKHCPRLMALFIGTETSSFQHNEQRRQSITDASIFSLAHHCSQLKQVYLNGCSGLTDLGLEALLSSCLDLQELDMSRTKVSNQLFDHLNHRTNRFSLKKLVMTDCNQIELAPDRGHSTTTGPFERILAKCHALTYLDLSNNTDIRLSSLYRFRMPQKSDPKQLSLMISPLKWEPCDDDALDACILTTGQLDRFRQYVNKLQCK